MVSVAGAYQCGRLNHARVAILPYISLKKDGLGREQASTHALLRSQKPTCCYQPGNVHFGLPGSAQAEVPVESVWPRGRLGTNLIQKASVLELYWTQSS
jgi:hypothetical protein